MRGIAGGGDSGDDDVTMAAVAAAAASRPLGLLLRWLEQERGRLHERKEKARGTDRSSSSAADSRSRFEARRDCIRFGTKERAGR